ncbi:glycosyltransferase family 4 protein [Parasphingorhabdus sp.]|uniref:glycosyltransferase family 4 protein n=1 Tax=Parasphingorhabdus sp. TaxID=2709688 RepID=UPI00326759FE
MNDFSVGGVTKNLELFQSSCFTIKYESEVVEVDPEWSIAPKFNTDIIFVHFPPSWRSLAFLYSLRGRNPASEIVWMEHSYNREWETLNVPVKSRFRAMLRCAVALFDEVICVSKAQANWLGEVTKSDESRFHVVSPWSYIEGLDDVCLPHFSADKALTIGAYGRFSKTKGFAELIEAVKLTDTSANIRLNIGGYGEQEQNFRKLAHGCRNIEFYGKVDSLSDFLGRCDVIAVPSYFESFGLVAAEAKMAGRPIMVAPVGGLPEQVEDCGIIVDCTDQPSLVSALNNLRQLPLQKMAYLARQKAMIFEEKRHSDWLGFLSQVAGRLCLSDSGIMGNRSRRPLPINMSAGQ